MPSSATLTSNPQVESSLAIRFSVPLIPFERAKRSAGKKRNEFGRWVQSAPGAEAGGEANGLGQDDQIALVSIRPGR